MRPSHYQELADRGWRREKKKQRSTFDLCRSVHETEYGNVKRPIDICSKKPIEPAHKFEVILEDDSYTAEKYALFENYQRVVHHEDPLQITEPGFRRFLCSGLRRTIVVDNGREKRLGSYHQCYRLDGRLIAMGVLDLLPHCVSSVYLMYYVSFIQLPCSLTNVRYHEDFSDWDFGKISALRETAPTYLLDPITHDWDLLDKDMLQRLAARRFVSMALERILSLPANPADVEEFSKSSAAATSRLDGKLEMGNVKYEKALEYVNGGVLDPEPSGLPNSTNVFEVGTPGVMSLAEVKGSIKLGEWGLSIWHKVVNLEDLVGWEESSMTDSDTIKGIAAELSACIGPDLVAKTLLVFNF
ncbi:MAG: hypothetical protein Q9163_000840 [Psora crenata]